MVTLVIVLAVVTLLGPVVGYFFGSSRQRKRAADLEKRLQELESDLRHRESPAPQWANRPAIPPMPLPPPPFGREGAARQQGPGPGPAQAVAAGQGPYPGATSQGGAHGVAPQPGSARGVASQPGGAHGMTPQHGGAHSPGPQRGPEQTFRPGSPERFAQEPPIFGDGSGSYAQQDAAPRALPPAQHPHPAHDAPEQPVPYDGQVPPAQQGSAPGQLPAESAVPQPRPAPSPRPTADPQTDGRGPSPIQTPPARPAAFTPVSDIIDRTEAKKLDWLSELSTGRRIRLQRLGYDAPEKLANLRKSEVTRLARELDVSEDAIRERWIPAAAAYLQARGKA